MAAAKAAENHGNEWGFTSYLWWGIQTLIQTFQVSGNRMLPPFVKIKQSFVLMQNTWKRNWSGEILVPFSQKKAFWPVSDAALIF